MKRIGAKKAAKQTACSTKKYLYFPPVDATKPMITVIIAALSKNIAFYVELSISSEY